MKITDLRVGNYISCTDFECMDEVPTELSEKYDKVLRIYDNVIQWNSISDDISYYSATDINYVDPIPITEEWLLSFGFKLDYRNSEHTKLYSNEKLTIDYNFTDKYIDFDNVLLAPDIKIEYVHQLQNLYYALTGEELELKK